VSDALPYAAAALAVTAAWLVGLVRLDVFTPDDVRAWRRLARLRGYAMPRTRLEKAATRAPILRRVQEELDLQRLLAIAGRPDTPLGFIGRAISWALIVFAVTFAIDAVGRTLAGDWPVTPWLAPESAAAVLLVAVLRVRTRARHNQEAAAQTLGDMLMVVAIVTDSRGLQVNDAVRVLSRCARDDALESLVDRESWRRLIARGFRSTEDLYRLIADEYRIPLFAQVADAVAATNVGVSERDVFTRLAATVYEDRLAQARVRAARAKTLVTLPVAAMLIPLLLLLGAPTLEAISNGLQGG